MLEKRAEAMQGRSLTMFSDIFAEVGGPLLKSATPLLSNLWTPKIAVAASLPKKRSGGAGSGLAGI